jgi:hypothetical protein
MAKNVDVEMLFNDGLQRNRNASAKVGEEMFKDSTSYTAGSNTEEQIVVDGAGFNRCLDNVKQLTGVPVWIQR